MKPLSTYIPFFSAKYIVFSSTTQYAPPIYIAYSDAISSR
jgi:hypothetical protein